MLLEGFGFSGYRSIGDELVKVAPLKKINLIIGRNNSGKSNIINFLYKHYKDFVDHAKSNRGHGLDDIDQHKSSTRATTRIAIPRLFTVDTDDSVRERLDTDVNARNAFNTLVDKLCDHNGYIWYVYEPEEVGQKYRLALDMTELQSALNSRQWGHLWMALTKQHGGGPDQWIIGAMTHLSPAQQKLPSIELIPAIRKVGDHDSAANDYSGSGIIDRLARIQSPAYNDQKSKARFDEINGFVRKVLEASDATLDVPYQRDMINVYMGGMTLPLSSLGTGIHEVIIFAVAATVLEDSVLCVEEPELHLHPSLQRKLLQYLSEETNNQYIFTTHSAHILDTVGAEVFHLVHSSSGTLVRGDLSTKEKSNICHDLGYRASDILQSNCIIWVEGPSDRIYINHWLKSIDEHLVEGTHYSIMFYGGRLASHISANDLDAAGAWVDDFISVRKMNRYASIVIDKDRKELGQTKLRLRDEFDMGPGHAWITDGKEIENYIAPKCIEECIQRVHKRADKIVKADKYTSCMRYLLSESKEERVADKIKVARYCTDNYPADLSRYDLSEKIHQVRKFIREANALPDDGE